MKEEIILKKIKELKQKKIGLFREARLDILTNAEISSKKVEDNRKRIVKEYSNCEKRILNLRKKLSISRRKK